MAWSEGLLRARSQIVFLLALASSTVAIVWLESLDLKARMRAEVETEIREAAIAERGPRPELAAALQAARRRAEEAFARSEPGSAAALLIALSTSVEAGLVRREEVTARVDVAVAALARETAATPERAAARALAALVFPDRAALLIEARSAP